MEERLTKSVAGRWKGERTGRGSTKESQWCVLTGQAGGKAFSLTMNGKGLLLLGGGVDVSHEAVKAVHSLFVSAEVDAGIGVYGVKGDGGAVRVRLHRS